MSRLLERRGLQAEGDPAEEPREMTIGLLLLNLDGDEQDTVARIFGPAEADILVPVVLLQAGVGAETPRGETRAISRTEVENAVRKLRKMIAAQSGTRPRALERNDLRLDPMAMMAEACGRRLDLTPREFELLQILMENARRGVSRRQIFEAVWGADIPFNANLLDVNMSRLRRKLEHALGRSAIKTIRGFGYRIV